MIGDTFPDFSLADEDGKIWTTDDLRGKRTIIYFYPKDDTSGCTAQACSLRDNSVEGYRLIGVSPDSVKSHRKFVDKYSLNFTLLADPDKALAQPLGVWVEKSLYGKKYMGVARTTFVLDENAKITHVFHRVKAEGHAEFLAEQLEAR